MERKLLMHSAQLCCNILCQLAFPQVCFKWFQDILPILDAVCERHLI